MKKLKKRKALWHQHRDYLQAEVLRLVNKANRGVSPERRVTYAAAIEVANRAIKRNGNVFSSARAFGALRAVSAFIEFATRGKDVVDAYKHADLLPVGHPSSTRSHSMTASALRHARARWYAADPLVDDELRPVVAAAHAAGYLTPERGYLFARLAAAPRSSLPLWLALDTAEAIVAGALSLIGGNSIAARRARAQLQRRDRGGRFAFMGGGFSWGIKLGDMFRSLTGRVVGASGDDDVEVEIVGDPDLPDGIYALPAKRGRSVKAVIKSKPGGKATKTAVDKDAVDASTLVRRDAPSGWAEVTPKDRQKLLPGAARLWRSNDGYFVELTPDGDKVLRRMDLATNKPGNEVARSKSWADVSKSARDDQDDYAKFIEEEAAKERAGAGEAVDLDPAQNITQQVSEAVKDGKKVRFSYGGKERIITPEKISTGEKSGKRNLLGKDTDGNTKSFTLDKIEAPGAPGEQPAAPPVDVPDDAVRFDPDGDLEAQLQQAIDSDAPIAFKYNDKTRVVFPERSKDGKPYYYTNPKNGNVNIVGNEAGSEQQKTYTLSKMSKVDDTAPPPRIDEGTLEERRASNIERLTATKDRLDKERSDVSEKIDAMERVLEGPDAPAGDGGTLHEQTRGNLDRLNDRRDRLDKQLADIDDKLERLRDGDDDDDPPPEDGYDRYIADVRAEAGQSWDDLTPSELRDWRESATEEGYYVGAGTTRAEQEKIYVDMYVDGNAKDRATWEAEQDGGPLGREVSPEVLTPEQQEIVWEGGGTLLDIFERAKSKDKLESGFLDEANGGVYRRMAELIDEMNDAHADSDWSRFVKNLREYDELGADYTLLPMYVDDTVDSVGRLLAVIDFDPDDAAIDAADEVFARGDTPEARAEAIKKVEDMLPSASQLRMFTEALDRVLDVKRRGDDDDEREEAKRGKFDREGFTRRDAGSNRDWYIPSDQDGESIRLDTEEIDGFYEIFSAPRGMYGVRREMDIFRNGGQDARDEEFDQLFDTIEEAQEFVEKQVNDLVEGELEAQRMIEEADPDRGVSDTEFDEMFTTPDGAYKPKIFDLYTPKGRTTEDADDYTDDPAVLANKFDAETLGRALKGAVLPDGQRAADGEGLLPFDGGDEMVPAEALYEALSQKGLDADMLLAGLYDSLLDEPVNMDKVKQMREDMRVGPDEAPDLVPTAGPGRTDAVRSNQEVATPTRARRARELMTDYEERNTKLTELAQALNDLDDGVTDAVGADDSTRGEFLARILPWSQGTRDEREAFRGLWGLLQNLGGGDVAEEARADMPEDFPLELESFEGIMVRSLEAAFPDRDGREMLDELYDEYGGFADFVDGKSRIADGVDDLDSGSIAAAFYRLTRAAARPSKVRLQRTIGVAPDDDILATYTTPGAVFDMDARSFTTQDLTSATMAGSMQFAPDSRLTQVVFVAAPGEVDSFNASGVSWFGEGEHVGFGTYEVVSVNQVRDLLNPKREKLAVEIRRARQAPERDIFDGDDTLDVSDWEMFGGQAGSNVGGFYRDADGNEYYVKVPKSQAHAENEALAAALYELTGTPAARTILGVDGGETRIVSPLIPGARNELGDRLGDEEYIRKLRDGFVVDAWIANWDVAGLVYDNVMSDADGNPTRVDPGGALLFRARGAEKGANFGDTVRELDTLRDRDLNPQNSRVFGGITDAELADQANRLRALDPAEVDATIDRIVSDPVMAATLKERLRNRRADIIQRVLGVDVKNEESAPLSTGTKYKTRDLQPGDVTTTDSFVIESVFTDADTPKGKMSVQGYFPGHESQRKEWNPTTEIDVFRGGPTPAKGDKPALHRPTPPRKPSDGAFTGQVLEALRGAGSWEEASRRLGDIELVFFDYETTGLPDRDKPDVIELNRPVQLGAVKVRNGEIVDRFNTYMDPDFRLSEWSAANLKRQDGESVTDEWLKTQPGMKEAHQQFIDWAGGSAILGGQYVPFDREVLERVLREQGLSFEILGTLDTKDIAASTLPRYSKNKPDGPSSVGEDGVRRASNSLGPIADYLGVEKENWHRADADAAMAANVLAAMLKRAAGDDTVSKELLDVDGTIERKRAADAQYEADLEAYKAAKADYEAAKAVAAAWNCGLTAAITGKNGPCDVPSVDTLIQNAQVKPGETADPDGVPGGDTSSPSSMADSGVERPEDDGVDVSRREFDKALKTGKKDVKDADKIIADDEDAKTSTRNRAKKVLEAFDSIVADFEDGKITGEEASERLKAIIEAKERSNDDIDFLATEIDLVADVFSGEAFKPKQEDGMPPIGAHDPKSGRILGVSKDGVTIIRPGMLVRDKNGFAGVVARYANPGTAENTPAWHGVHVIGAIDGKQYNKVTWQLTPIMPGDDDSIYIEGPKGYTGHKKKGTEIPDGSIKKGFKDWDPKAKAFHEARAEEDDKVPKASEGKVPKASAPEGASEPDTSPDAPEGEAKQVEDFIAEWDPFKELDDVGKAKEQEKREEAEAQKKLTDEIDAERARLRAEKAPKPEPAEEVEESERDKAISEARRLVSAIIAREVTEADVEEMVQSELDDEDSSYADKVAYQKIRDAAKELFGKLKSPGEAYGERVKDLIGSKVANDMLRAILMEAPGSTFKEPAKLVDIFNEINEYLKRDKAGEAIDTEAFAELADRRMREVFDVPDNPEYVKHVEELEASERYAYETMRDAISDRFDAIEGGTADRPPAPTTFDEIDEEVKSEVKQMVWSFSSIMLTAKHSGLLQYLSAFKKGPTVQQEAADALRQLRDGNFGTAKDLLDWTSKFVDRVAEGVAENAKVGKASPDDKLNAGSIMYELKTLLDDLDTSVNLLEVEESNLTGQTLPPLDVSDIDPDGVDEFWSSSVNVEKAVELDYLGIYDLVGALSSGSFEVLLENDAGKQVATPLEKALRDVDSNDASYYTREQVIKYVLQRTKRILTDNVVPSVARALESLDLQYRGKWTSTSKAAPPATARQIAQTVDDLKRFAFLMGQAAYVDRQHGGYNLKETEAAKKQLDALVDRVELMVIQNRAASPRFDAEYSKAADDIREERFQDAQALDDSFVPPTPPLRAIDVEGVDWDSSPSTEVLSLNGALQRADAIADARKGRGKPENEGRTTADIVRTLGDGTDIEDMAIDVVSTANSDGTKELTRVQYKLTKWASDRFMDELKAQPDVEVRSQVTLPITAYLPAAGEDTSLVGLKRETMYPPPPGWEGGHRTVESTLVFHDYGFLSGYLGKNGQYYYTRVIDGVEVKFQYIKADYDEANSGSYKSFSNLVTIDVPRGTDPTVIAKAMQLGGVNDPRAATLDDTRLLVENRLIAVLGGKVDANRYPTNEVARAAQLAEINSKYGVSADQFELRVGTSGRIELVGPPSLGEAIRNKTRVDLIFHSITQGNFIDGTRGGFQPDAVANGIANMFKPGQGLRSTNSRVLRGGTEVGASSQTDTETGGADYVFTTPADGVSGLASNIHKGTGGWGTTFIVYDAPELFRRVDFFGNKDDEFGRRRAPKREEEKADTDWVIDDIVPGAYELMFKGEIGHDAVAFIVVGNESEKNRLVTALKARGINKIGGQAVEVVVTYGIANDVVARRGNAKVTKLLSKDDLEYRYPNETFSDGTDVLSDPVE
jgi:DNA polymerase III epsilon subunit-like protein